MTDTTLTQIKSRLVGGGARPNLFEIEIPSFPSGLTWTSGGEATLFSCLCKAGGLPASNVGVVEVPFRGRTFKVAGDRTFDTWTVTIINDDDFSLRKRFEEWAQKMANYQDGSGSKNPSDYMAEAYVTQLRRNASSIGDGGSNSAGTGLSAGRKYKFVDIWPSNVSQIDLSYDSTDTIEEFTVEFQVNYWYPESGGGLSPAATPTTATTPVTPTATPTVSPTP
jgi:hypothetical protein